MKIYFTPAALLGLLWLAACGQKDSVSELEKAFAQPAPAAQAEPAGQPAPEAGVRQTLDMALGALRANNYEDAAASLTVLRANPQLTADQLMAVQDAMASLQQQLVQRMEAGDPAAQRAFEAIRGLKRR